MHGLTEPFLRLLAATVVGTVIGINRDFTESPPEFAFMRSLQSPARSW